MTEQAAENEVLGKQSTLLVENLFFFCFFFGCFKSFCFRSLNVVLPDYLLRFLCLQHLFFLFFFLTDAPIFFLHALRLS